MDFLRGFDQELYDLSNEIKTSIYEKPAEAMFKSILFIKNLENKSRNHHVELRDVFNIDIARIQNMRLENNRFICDVSIDEVLKVYEKLFEMAAWYIRTFEAPNYRFPPYSRPLPKKEVGISEKEAVRLVEEQVNNLWCGIVKEMDLVLVALDDVEHQLAGQEKEVERLKRLQWEVADLMNKIPTQGLTSTTGFAGLLKSRSRTPKQPKH